jgi:hypothetical protein
MEKEAELIEPEKETERDASNIQMDTHRYIVDGIAGILLVHGRGRHAQASCE